MTDAILIYDEYLNVRLAETRALQPSLAHIPSGHAEHSGDAQSWRQRAAHIHPH